MSLSPAKTAKGDSGFSLTGSLDDAFFLYEDDEDYILRFYQFSKGLTKCFIIISTKPEIEASSSNMDSRLLAQISNILLNWIVDCVKDIRK